MPTVIVDAELISEKARSFLDSADTLNLDDVTNGLRIIGRNQPREDHFVQILLKQIRQLKDIDWVEYADMIARELNDGVRATELVSQYLHTMSLAVTNLKVMNGFFSKNRLVSLGSQLKAEMLSTYFKTAYRTYQCIIGGSTSYQGITLLRRPDFEQRHDFFIKHLRKLI